MSDRNPQRGKRHGGCLACLVSKKQVKIHSNLEQMEDKNRQRRQFINHLVKGLYTLGTIFT